MSPLQQVFAFAASKQFLPLAILLIGYLVQLLSPMSKFPLTIPFIKGRDPRPLIAALLGLAYGVLISVQGGDTPSAAILHGLLAGGAAMGLFDLLVKFVFNGTPPVWLSVLVRFLTATPPPSEQPTNPTGLDSRGSVRAGLVWAVALLLAAASTFGIALALAGCTAQEAKTIADIGVQISEDVCNEESVQPDEPEWVKLACQGVGVAAPIVHVLLPRTEWSAIKARKVKHPDAGKTINLGPGK